MNLLKPRNNSKCILGCLIFLGTSQISAQECCSIVEASATKIGLLILIIVIIAGGLYLASHKANGRGKNSVKNRRSL